MTTDLQDQALAHGILESLGDRDLVLAVPGTEYRLQLVPTLPPDQFRTPVGRRIRGTIQARALRVHPAGAGGRFVEPVWGQPRIVQGVVIGRNADRLLVDVSVPIWVTLQEGQDPADFAVGQTLNFYVQSGATFTPLLSS